MSYLDPTPCVSPYCNDFVEYNEGSNLCYTCRCTVDRLLIKIGEKAETLKEMQVVWFLCDRCCKTHRGQPSEKWQGHRLCKACSEEKYVVRYECTRCKRFCQSNVKTAVESNQFCGPCYDNPFFDI